MYMIADPERNALRPASVWRLRAMARQLAAADAGSDREAAWDMACRARVRLSDRDRATLRGILGEGRACG